MYITLRFKNNQLRILVRHCACKISLRNVESVLCLIPAAACLGNNCNSLTSRKSTYLLIASAGTLSNIKELALCNVSIVSRR